MWDREVGSWERGFEDWRLQMRLLWRLQILVPWKELRAKPFGRCLDGGGVVVEVWLSSWERWLLIEGSATTAMKGSVRSGIRGRRRSECECRVRVRMRVWLLDDTEMV